MKKKFLALVMTLSMVLSLVPMTALATGDGEPAGQSTTTAENQAAGEGAGNQDSSSITGGDKNTTGGEDSTNTPDTNTNNGNKGSESENAGGTESGSTSSGGGTECGSTTEGSGTDGGTVTEPEAPKNAAKIGNTKYETLDAAIEAARENDVIELLKDCELTVGTINKTITINGNGKKVDVPKQEKIKSGALAINAPATFNNTQLSFANESNWSVTMSDDGVFTLDENSVCNIEHHGIYAKKNAVINVQKASKLIIQNTDYTAMMAEHGPDGKKTSDPVTAQLNITGGSTVKVNNTTAENGINWFKIHVTNSFLYIKECANQGLVKCELVLDSSEAEISENAIGITGFTNDEVATLNNNSTLKMENNKEAGLFMWGGSVNVHKGNSLTISGTGSSVAEPQDESWYAALGLNSMNGSVTIEDGAEVNIIDNDVSGIYNKGTMTLGDSTVITENGKRNQRATHGGGIDNHGAITVSAKAQVYNNHAATAGDDIYNTGTITFGDVGEGWVLDDCNHAITGWYDDGENARWCADTLPRHLKEYAPESGETHQLALKAAHGVDPVPLPEPKLETPEIDKTATPLNQDKSTVTLTVGGSEEKANIAVMFLLDKSTSQTKARQNAAEMLWNLKEKTNTNIIYDVVIFSGTATSTGWRNIADDGTVHDSIANFANIGTTSGTNMTAGIDQAKKDMKTLSESYPEYKDSTFLVTISDGVSYYWDENGVTKCVPIAAWNGNETVFETTPRSDVSTWEMMYSAGTSLKDVYGGVSQFLAVIPDKMQATREKNYVRDYNGGSTDLEDPLTTYIYNPTKKQTVADTYASAAEFSMYYSIQGYADLVKSFARVYTLPMPEVNTDGSEKETWTKDYPWGREVMLYLQDYSTNAGAGIFHDANSEEIFQEIKDEILYSIQSGVVTDIIGENFDLTDRNKLTENTFTLKVGGVTLDATVDASNDKVVYFGTADENGMYPYEVKYQPASTDKEEQLIWTINKPVERSKRLTLSYSLDLINKKTASGTYTEPTNKNAVLDYVTTTNEEGQLIFPVPTVSYTVSGGGGGGGGGGSITIPDDVPTGLDLKNHYGYIIGYPVDYYTGKPTTDQTKKPVRPEGKITRAEVATIYFRMLTDENRAANWNQVSGFSDVKSSAWYNNAISTLTKAGILKGYEDGTFQPNGYITRAEFATIAIRFFSGVYEGEDLFPDIKGHWAEDYINNAANKGLVKGYEDGTFGPDRYITRAEAVTLVNRTLNRHPHNDGLHQDMLRWPDNMDTSKWYYADMQEATNSHEPDKNKSTADKEYWGKMLPIRDWEALEKEWSNANSAPGEGEVV